MAKHLQSRHVKAIVDTIRGWSNRKLTWDAVCDSSAKLLRHRYARQTIYAHDEIRSAYKAKKEGLQARGSRPAMPSSLAIAAQRLARQQAVTDELKAKNSALLEQFVRWQYNAYKHGLTELHLNEDLPRIDRERTVLAEKTGAK